MMGTHADLDGRENVAVMQFMETESLKLAKQKQFTGIFTTNTSPLTQVIIFFSIFTNYKIINIFFYYFSNLDQMYMGTKPC